MFKYLDQIYPVRVAYISSFAHYWGVAENFMEREAEVLTVAAVARRLGVAPATLRTWDRRYGLGPSEHNSGEHRRYNCSDLARLTLMRKLVIAGVTPAEAAQRALNSDQEVSSELISRSISQDIEVREELVETLIRAARAYDRTFIEELLRSEILARGITNTWNEIIVPLLILIGNDWAETGTGIEIEHMASDIITRLMQEVECPQDPINSRPVLLACIGEEVHSLALHTLGAALSERGIATQFLGAQTPIEAISAVVKRSAPPAIFLWAQLDRNGNPEVLSELPNIRPAPRIILGGPGWKVPDSKSAVLVGDLLEACEEITRAVGA